VDTGDELPHEVSLLDLGFRFPPILRLGGASPEFFVVFPPPLTTRAAVKWLPNMTVTNVLMELEKRVRPHDYRLMRIFVENVKVGEDSVTRREIGIEKCFRYPQPTYLNKSMSMCDLGLCVGHDDPLVISFLRTKNGAPVVIELTVAGSTLVQRIEDIVLGIEARREEERFIPQITTDAVNALDSGEGYDDDDEEIAPGGTKRVYFHGSRPHPMFSFNPPLSDQDRPAPRFISIDEDFTIPHVSDLGIFPGSEIIVEFFDPSTLEWSGDLSESVSVALGGSPNEFLTVRMPSRRQILRVPATPRTTFEAVSQMIWFSTGELPMFMCLMTESGRLLQPYETIASASLLPQSTVYFAPRPRPWFNEVLRAPPLVGPYGYSVAEPDLDGNEAKVRFDR
jgi:hypothetical protein